MMVAGLDEGPGQILAPQLMAAYIKNIKTNLCTRETLNFLPCDSMKLVLKKILILGRGWDSSHKLPTELTTNPL